MKKILSSILAAATIASVMIFPASAEAKNVTQEVNVPYFSQKPTFDGVINAEEWGEKSFTVSGADAAKPGDTAPADNNTFIWYEHVYDELDKKITSEDAEGKSKMIGLTYDVWLRWDLEYLYLAVKVNDPDGYYLPAGRERIWDGDCVQFRVDPQGPNGYLSYKNPDYDYKTDDFDLELSANVGYDPWSYSTKICNIGLGYAGGKAQAYDMADQGTGKMTKQQLLNDPKKLGPNVNPLKDENNYASEFAMKTCTENGDGTNTYECAVPWVFLNQWGYGQVAVGYAWGMSLVVLNGYDDGDTLTAPFDGYLTWGSGICGAQQDDAWLRTTAGGSNAIVLSDVDALSGDTVADLPQVQEPGPDDTEVVHNVMDVSGMNAYYLSATPENAAVDGDFELSLDIAYLGDDPINPDRTYVGVLIGEGYSMAAGWDKTSKKFFVAEQGFQNGINKDIPYSESEEEFDWPVGEWHNLTVKIVDETVTVSLDGKVMVEDTDSRNTCFNSTSPTYEVIVYNIGDYVYDNYTLTTGEYVYAYTMDSDDEVFNRSDMKLSAIPMANEIVKGECKNANPDSKYGCLLHTAVNAEGKTVLTCDFCGYEEAAAAYGDANTDGKINLSDVSLILKHVAKWSDLAIDLTAADANADDKINLADASLVLKHIAKWDVVLGPQA